MTLPEGLVEESPPITNDDYQELPRWLRVKLDALASQGDPSRLRKLIAFGVTLPHQSEKIAETVAKVPEKLPQAQAAVSTLPSGGLPQTASGALNLTGQAAAHLQEYAEKLSELHKNSLGEISATLKQSSSTYLRLIAQPRFYVKSGKLQWEHQWTPQVLRGMNLKDFKLHLEHEIPLLPLVSAFFGVGFQFRKESAEFEILGLDTLTYLKVLHHGLKSGKGERWEAYWKAHWLEIIEIFKNVADVRPDDNARNDLHDHRGESETGSLKRLVRLQNRGTTNATGQRLPAH